jgi:hypothetical protein
MSGVAPPARAFLFFVHRNQPALFYELIVGAFLAQVIEK